WWQWPVVRPFPVTPLFHGLKEIEIMGVSGAMIDVIEVKGDDSQTLLGQTTLDTNGIGTVRLARPLSNAGTYSLRDRTNSLSNEGFTSRPPRTHVAKIAPPIVEGLGGGTQVTLTGLFLNEVREVAIDGVPTQIVSQR